MMPVKTIIRFLRVLILILFLPVILNANETIGNLESRFKKAESDSMKFELILQMGDHFEHTDFDAALHFYKEALDMAEKKLDQSPYPPEKKMFELLRIKVLGYIALHHKLWGRYEDALDAYEVFGQAYLKVNDIDGYINTTISKGNIFYYQGLYPQALEHYHQGLILAEQNNLYHLVASIKLNYGACYYLLGNYILSLSYHQQALELADSLGIERNRGSIFLGMGNIYSELSDFENAMKFYNMALDHFTKFPNNDALANIHISIGALYFESDMNDEAEKHYLEALDHAILLRSQRMEAHTLLNLGQVYVRKKESEKAFDYFNRALKLAEETNNQHIKANILRNLANLYLYKGNYNLAYRNARESLEIAQSIESVSVQSLGWKVLSEIREKQGLFQDALIHYQQYKILNDSLIDIEKQKKLTEMDALYQSEKQMQAMELKQLELDKSNADLRQKKQLANIFIIAFAVVVIFGVSIFVFNNRRIRNDRLVKKQNKVIQEKHQKNIQLVKQTELQNEKIMQLEKEIAINEKNYHNDLSFATELKDYMLPGLEVLPAAFNGRAFMFSNTRRQSEKSGLLWVKQQEDTIVIALAGCSLPAIKGSLVNLYITLLLEKFSQNIYLKDPRIMAENINEQIQHLTSQMDISHSRINISLLWINITNYKVVFSGEQIALYLAIARMRKDPTQKLNYDYHELQKFDGDKFQETENSVTKNNILTEIQLKKADRLYLIGQCQDEPNEKIQPKEPSFIDNNIIPLLDEHQDKEINLHKTFLKSYFSELKEPGDMPDNIKIVGMEL
jgi:tetratricopeptide (TPR) repeat protein